MSSGKNSDLRAIDANRELHLSNLKRQELIEVGKLSRLQQEDQRRRLLRDEIAKMGLSFAAMTGEELERYRAEITSKIKTGRGYFAGSFKRSTDIA